MSEDSKIIEFIRKILIKTVLPIRKKKEAYASKIRLSIKLRIAFAYGKILIIHGIIMVLVFCLATLIMNESNYISNADEIITNLKNDPTILDKDSLEDNIEVYYKNGDNYEKLTDEQVDIENYKSYIYQKQINPYSSQGMTMRVENKKTGDIVYDDIKEYVVDKSQFYDKAYVKKDSTGYTLIIIEQREVTLSGKDYKIYFQIDYSQRIKIFIDLAWIMLLAIFVLTILLARGGVSRIEPIFAPINQMADAANRLTVNNLKSERLNEAGTKNELRDLAGTINKMLDRLDLSYESQKQFVSDASHELRTPIAVIQGYVNMLDRWGKEDPEILEESIEAIKNESRSMQDLVEKLLFLSRHDKKTLKLDKKIFNMKTVVDEMVKETKLVVKERNIVYDISESAYVYADKQSIKQALRIFIDNAVKYSAGGDSIIIKCRNENGACAVSIEDTGIGMTRKDVDNMFERFYRSDNVRNLQISGNGLGLSLAKLIILKHTGTIKVKTQLTKGSCFTVMFPPVEVQ